MKSLALKTPAASPLNRHALSCALVALLLSTIGPELAAAAPTPAVATSTPAGTRYAPSERSSEQRPPGMPATTVKTAPSEVSAPTFSGRVLGHAADLHGAIALQDWSGAAESAQALRQTLGQWIDGSPDSLPLRGQLLAQLASVPRVEQSIQNRQLRPANEEAYSLMQALLALGDIAPGTTGGGGGLASSVTGQAEQHLRKGYRAVVLSHAALVRGDIGTAQSQLELVRQALQSALGSKPGAVFTKRLEELNQRRWRVIASLQNVSEARQRSRELTAAYARAIHAVGNYAASQEARPSPPPRTRSRGRT
jgi:hypothetical protein